MSALRGWWHHRVMPHPGTHQEPAAAAPEPAKPAQAQDAPSLWPHPAIARLQRDIKVMREIGDERGRAAYFAQQYGHVYGEKPQLTVAPELAKRVLS